MYANNKFVVIISLMTFNLLSTHHDQFFFIKNDDISAVNYHPPFPSVNITAFQKSYFIISNCIWYPMFMIQSFIKRLGGGQILFKVQSQLKRTFISPSQDSNLEGGKTDQTTCTKHIWKHTYCLLFIFRKGGLTKDTPVDLVLSCVDNFEARMAINTVSIAREIVMCTFVW